MCPAQLRPADRDHGSPVCRPERGLRGRVGFEKGSPLFIRQMPLVWMLCSRMCAAWNAPFPERTGRNPTRQRVGSPPAGVAAVIPTHARIDLGGKVRKIRSWRCILALMVAAFAVKYGVFDVNACVILPLQLGVVLALWSSGVRAKCICTLQLSAFCRWYVQR